MDLLNDIIIFTDLLKVAVNIHSPVELNRILNEKLGNDEAMKLRSAAKEIISEETKTPVIEDVESALIALEKLYRTNISIENFYTILIAKLYKRLTA